MSEEIKPYYQQRAKNLTDFLYDKGFLDHRLAREAINVLENYIAWEMQSMCDMAVKGAQLSRSTRDLIAKNATLTKMSAGVAAEQSVAQDAGPQPEVE